MIDPSQVFNPQPTPYPVHPLVQLLRSVLGMTLLQRQLAQQKEESEYAKQVRAAQQRELQLAPLRERYNFYLQQYAQDPRGAFRAAYEEHPEFRELAKQLYQFTAEPGPAIAPPQGAFGESQASGPGVGPAQLGTPAATQAYRLPGPPPPAFRTVGELAQRFGLKLRPGVDPSLPIEQLPRGFDLNQLLIDPEALREQERAAARARLEQVTKIYSVQQIFSTPALRDPFLRDYQLVFGQPFPTQRAPEMRIVQPPVAGTGPGLALVGTQQPIGPLTEQPILPQVPQEPPRRVVIYDPNTGKPISTFEVPAGTEVRAGTTPGQPTLLVDKNGRIIQQFPPGVRVQVVTPPGGGGAAETQARMKADLMRRYLRGEKLNEREERILFGTAGEDVLSAKDREILRMWRDNLDPLTGDPKDKELAGRLRPHVDRITNQLIGGAAPAPGAPGGITPQMRAGIEQDAKGGIEWKETEAALRQLGIADPKLLAEARRIYNAAKGGGTQPPGPGRRTGEVVPTPVSGRPAPSPRAAQLLQYWQRTKKPIPRGNWNSLTPQERDWLTMQGVKAA